MAKVIFSGTGAVLVFAMRQSAAIWLWLILAGATAVSGGEGVWRFGTARAKITPEKLFWMAGFAARTKPAEGTLDDLWAKVLVLEDQGGELCVLVTADLLGVPKWLYDDLCSGLERPRAGDATRLANPRPS